MTDVSLAPLAQAAGQLMLAVIDAAIIIATPTVAYYVTKYFSLKFTDNQWAVFDRTAQNFAGQIWARADTSLASASINISNPTIAASAQMAVSTIPAIISGLGLTPEAARDAMAQYLLSHLGKMQSTAPVASTASAVAVAPPAEAQSDVSKAEKK